MTVNVLTRSVGPHHAITLTISDPDLNRFQRWRVEIRNRVDHLRRVDPRWREFGVHGWLQRDGTIRGVVSLGGLGPIEVTKGLVRWGAVLGAAIEPEDLRVLIWSAAKPQAIYIDGPPQGRYWPVRCSIWRCRVTPESTLGCHAPMRDEVGPMPWIM